MINAALISGLFALSGALGGQAYNNYLTNKRERKKYQREIYQELLSPVLLDVIAFYDIKTAFRKGHDIKDDIKEGDLILKIKERVSSKIIYANTSVISAFYDLKKFDYFEDFSGVAQEEYEVKLCLALLDETYKYVKKEKLLYENQLILINNYRIKYFIWSLLIKYLGAGSQTTEVLSWFWCISPDIFKETFYEHLKVRFEFVKQEYFANVFESEFKHHVNDGQESIFKNMIACIRNELARFPFSSDNDFRTE